MPCLLKKAFLIGTESGSDRPDILAWCDACLASSSPFTLILWPVATALGADTALAEQ